MGSVYDGGGFKGGSEFTYSRSPITKLSCGFFFFLLGGGVGSEFL